MLSSEEIVLTVKEFEFETKNVLVPILRPKGKPEAMSVTQSIKRTLFHLSAHPSPFVGGEIVPRIIPARGSSGTKLVETAIWPIHYINPVPCRDGSKRVTEFVFDAYGDLMGRRITAGTGFAPDPSWVKKLDTSSLHPHITEQVLLKLESFRSLLDQQRLSRQPSLV